jgi:hypothetical protein
VSNATIDYVSNAKIEGRGRNDRARRDAKVECENDERSTRERCATEAFDDLELRRQ